MLPSLSYQLLQALFSLVLRTKTLAVTLDSTFYYHGRRHIHRVSANSPRENQAYLQETFHRGNNRDQTQPIRPVYSSYAQEE